ncbi:TRAP transporter small permease [Oricola cellulosilytica]|uniref:TRAP transporter small permease protein n=1 Tax=Oricola cellulosilytica TaxID=1429082 RepID=A0A4R0PDE8_9HYPH|nr:TRAP transporter small permease subunit [Oricola cellulosilytica]TCD14359.1 TRAP transporter small permease subunit [Oricola cellulosilytica]
MRRFLNGLYAISLGLSALCLTLIAILVAAQIAGRVGDRILLAFGTDAVGLAVPSLAEIGGFLFVAASTLALAPTLKSASHVRVTVLAAALGAKGARVLDSAMLAGATVLAVFAAWHSTLQLIDSWKFGSVSYGVVPVPLWIPQAAMSAGFVVLAIAVVDELVTLLRGGVPDFRREEEGRDAVSGAVE